MPKKKLVIYLPESIYDKLMQEVLIKVQKTKRFRGVLSEVVTEIIKEHVERECDKNKD